MANLFIDFHTWMTLAFEAADVFSLYNICLATGLHYSSPTAFFHLAFHPFPEFKENF